MVDGRFIILVCFIAVQLVAGGCTQGQYYAFLPKEMRRDIYLEISTLVAEHLEKGNEYYENEEYHEALKNYRMALFYDHSLTKIQERVELLEKRILADSEKYFQQGLALLDSDRVGALKAFNRAVHINCGHEKARRHSISLLHEAAFQTKLAKLEEELDQNFRNYGKKEEEIIALSEQTELILAFDHQNNKALAVKSVLEEDKLRFLAQYIEKGEKFLEENKLDNAKESFKKAKPFAKKKNKKIRKYLQEIQKQKDIQYILNLAKYRLRKEDYRKAVEFAGKVLSMDSRNNEAKQILSTALLGHQKATINLAKHYFEQRDYVNALASLDHLLTDNTNGDSDETVGLINIIKEKFNRELEQMLSEGQDLYDKKKLTESLTLFEFVLQVDSENERAKMFIKKIHSRLETIESLQ